ncbi:MAG: hypothetical protein WCR83_06875, partial [Candidatus Methanomethylophilaceae archaeon]
YTVSYSPNVNVGTVTVTIDGTGNYTGTVTFSFQIIQSNISGTVTISTDSPVVGITLYAVVTGVSPAEAQTSLTYQWYADGSAIEGAIGSSYTVTAAQLGMTIYLEITGTGNYQSTITSEVTNAVLSDVYNVTLYVDPSDAGTVSGAGTYDMGSDVTVQATANSDYRFIGWYADGVLQSTETSYTFEIDHNVAFTAKYEQIVFSVTASAGSNGTISPVGTTKVDAGGSYTFYVSPETNYVILDVTINGASVGAVTSYTLVDIRENTSVIAIFDLISFKIYASSNAGGYILPSGLVPVYLGSSTTYTITTADGYETVDVLVDGRSVGAVSSYTFTDVQTEHTIYASFRSNTSSDESTVTVNVNNSGEPDSSVVVNGIPITDGSIVVSKGDSTISITPDEYYYIAALSVNGTEIELTDDMREAGYDLTFDVESDSVVDIQVKKIYDQRTLVDGETGISVSGEIRYNSQIIVEKITVDPSSWGIDVDSSKYTVAYDIHLSNTREPYYGQLTVSIAVGEQYDGAIIEVAHMNSEGVVDVYEHCYVSGGAVTITVSSLSPFMVVLPVGEAVAYTDLLYLIPLLGILLIVAIWKRRSTKKEEEFEERESKR